MNDFAFLGLSNFFLWSQKNYFVERRQQQRFTSKLLKQQSAKPSKQVNQKQEIERNEYNKLKDRESRGQLSNKERQRFKQLQKQFEDSESSKPERTKPKSKIEEGEEIEIVINNVAKDLGSVRI